MLALDPLNPETWTAYLLIFARMSGLVFLFPFFRRRGVPVMLRAWIAIILSFLVFLSLSDAIEVYSPGAPETVMAIISEVLVGLALGFLIFMFFQIFIMMGQFVSRQAGLMFSRVFDPTSGEQVNILGQFYSLIAIIFYLTVNGHHLLIKAMTDSFKMIPLGVGLFVPELAGGVARLSADVILISFQISAPIIFMLLIFNIALGLVAKTVPQIHIFMMALPLKILGSMILLALLLPFLGTLLEALLDWFLRSFYQIMQGWS